MTLYIDTANGEDIFLALRRGDIEIDAVRVLARQEQAEKLLPTLEKLLKKNKSKLSDLKKIEVNNNGDSFTALRIGVVTANALAYALKIPVNDSTMVKPIYNREANIG